MTPPDSTQTRTSQTDSPPVGGSPLRPGVIFAVVALALLMSTLDQTIVATALHTLQRDLHAPITWVSWTMTVYSLGLLLALPLAGRLSEQFGRRRVFLVSVAVFTTASLCCGLAPNIYVLVALRFLQAMGGAGFTPSATGIIVDYLGPSRDRALGMFAALFSIGAMIGPIFGGLFVTYWSWRGIFFVNVPIGIALAVLCVRFIPADPPRESAAREPFDLVGMIEVGVGVLGLMVALNALSKGGGALRTPQFLAPAVVAVLALVAFARHIRWSPHPFIAPRFVMGHGFGAVNMVNAGAGVAQGLIALVPLYAVTRYGMSVLDSGTLLTAEGAAVIIMSTVAVAVLRRTGYRLPILLGLVVTAIGLVVLSASPHRLSPYAWLAVAAAILGLGTGWLSPASRNAGLQLAPESSPTLAALRTMSIQIGLIAAIAITTAIISGAAHPGLAHAHAYLGWAVFILLLTPIVTRVPEHHGAW
ncbi:MAG: MFS transporter [Rhodanobacteraceae bacterium]